MYKFFSVVTLSLALAAPSSAQAFDSGFPEPTILKPSIEFWTRVFGEFSEYQSVIHYEEQPYKIYAILDFRDEIAAGRSIANVRSLQKRVEESTKRRLNEQLRKVHQHRDNPQALDGEERLLWSLLSDSDEPNRYKNAVGEWRAQRGLKERTRRALEVSGAYLPEMERIFEAYGLPTRLTRLPLVESSFNVEAYSKVGAAGLWQFMPSSARIYMQLNEAVDQRADPWASTEAAAKHLRDDYETLGNWPLALTAYNHGRGGLARGLRETGGSTLEDLLTRWDGGRRFGFASRNFYAEFIAASNVEDNYRSHFGSVDRDSPLRFETVSTDHYVPYEVLQRCAGVDDETFRRLNPSYRPDVIEGNLYVPPSDSIRVPVGHAGSFRTLYAALAADQRFEGQRNYYAQHRVRNGDTFQRIAKFYGTSVRAVLAANPGIKPNRLRAGQMVRIPPRGGRANRT